MQLNSDIELLLKIFFDKNGPSTVRIRKIDIRPDKYHIDRRLFNGREDWNGGNFGYTDVKVPKSLFDRALRSAQSRFNKNQNLNGQEGFNIGLNNCSQFAGEMLSKAGLEILSSFPQLAQIASRLSQRLIQSLQESIFSPPKKKLKNKKSPTLQKNKTSFHRTMQTLTDTTLNVNHFGQSECKLDTTHLRTTRRASGNKVLPKAGVTSFYDTFMLNRTLVFQINSSAVTPRLRQYPNR